jgi:hypothetical protein
MQQLKFFTMVFLLFFANSFAKAELSLLNLKSENQTQNLLSTANSKLGFVQYKNFKLYRLGVKAGGNLDGFKVADESTATVRANTTTVLMYVDNLSGSIALRNAANNNRTLEYTYQPKAQDFGVQNSKCSEYNLTIKATKKPPAGTLLAFSCEKVGDKIILTLSTLGTADINSSSVNELDGKGETWRAFDLGTVKAEAATVLELGLSKAGQDFGLKIVSKKIEDKKGATPPPEDPRQKQQIRAGLAYSMATISITNSYSDASPGIFVGFTSKPLFWGTKFDADFKQGFAAEDPKAISTSDLKIGLKKDIELGSKNFLFVPQALFVNSKYSQQLSGLDINLVSYGAGLGLSYFFSNRDSFDLSYKMISFGSNVVSSASTIQIKVNFVLFTSYNLILGLEMQNLAGQSTSGNTIKVDQNVLLFGLGFD